MTTIVGPLPNQISDGQVADAVPVMNNFNWLLNQVNANGAPNNVNFPLPALGSLLNFQQFTAVGTSTYTATTGANSVIVIVIGGGGAGGGAPGTGVGQVSAGAGGGSGSAVISRFLSGFNGATVTVGAGGANASGASGNFGTPSVFACVAGNLNAQGGQGGTVSGPSSAASVQGASSGTPLGGNLLTLLGRPGGWTSIVPGSFSVGNGGSSLLGTGGQGFASANGGAGNGYGGGGGGTVNGASASALGGGGGSNGVVWVFEFA